MDKAALERERKRREKERKEKRGGEESWRGEQEGCMGGLNGVLRGQAIFIYLIWCLWGDDEGDDLCDELWIQAFKILCIFPLFILFYSFDMYLFIFNFIVLSHSSTLYPSLSMLCLSIFPINRLFWHFPKNFAFFAFFFEYLLFFLSAIQRMCKYIRTDSC